MADLTKDLARDITGRDSGGDGLEPNVIIYNSYADRALEVSENAWVHNILFDCVLLASADGSSATVSTPPTLPTGFVLDIIHNSTVVGTITFALGELGGTISLSSDLLLTSGDTLTLQTTVADSTVVDLSVSLLTTIIGV